jgi:hypothetical protein
MNPVERIWSVFKAGYKKRILELDGNLTETNAK